MHLFCSEAISLGVIHNPSTSIDVASGRSRAASSSNSSSSTTSTQQLLITPELWKTNCNRSSASHHDNPPIDEALNLVKRAKLCHVGENVAPKGEADNFIASKKGKTHRTGTLLVDQLGRFQFPAKYPIWHRPSQVVTPPTNQIPIREDFHRTVDLTLKSDLQSAFHNPQYGEGGKSANPTVANETKSDVFPIVPPNFVMTPYPILIPLPIPVPIPIPIDIHEKFN